MKYIVSIIDRSGIKTAPVCFTNREMACKVATGIINKVNEASAEIQERREEN